VSISVHPRLVAFLRLRFTELLHWSKKVLAVGVLFKIDTTALRDPPLRGLYELGLLGNLIAEASCGAAAFQTSAHEDAVSNCAGQPRFLLVTGDGFVDATLIVALAAKVPPFGHDFLAPGDPSVLVARDPVDAGDHDTDYKYDYDNHDYQ